MLTWQPPAQSTEWMKLKISNIIKEKNYRKQSKSAHLHQYCQGLSVIFPQWDLGATLIHGKIISRWVLWKYAHFLQNSRTDSKIHGDFTGPIGPYLTKFTKNHPQFNFGWQSEHRMGSVSSFSNQLEKCVLKVATVTRPWNRKTKL